MKSECYNIHTATYLHWSFASRIHVL